MNTVLRLLGVLKKIQRDGFLDSIEILLSLERALVIRIFYRKRLQSVGTGLRIRGAKFITFGDRVCLGRFNWIEAVTRYGNQTFTPKITIGNDVAFSDFVHISSALEIEIKDGTLIGSKVYVGDHSHGYQSASVKKSTLSPRYADLCDLNPISIGKNCWIGDGVVVLAGSNIADGSVIGANSVVKVKTERPALICGAPARVIKYYD